MVEASSADGINMILTLLEGLLGDLRVWDNWLEPEGMNPCITCHRPKVFLGVLGGSYGGDWTLFACEAPYSKESPRASGFLCPNGSVAGRFCKSKSLVSLLRSSESSN